MKSDKPWQPFRDYKPDKYEDYDVYETGENKAVLRKKVRITVRKAISNMMEKGK